MGIKPNMDRLDNLAKRLLSNRRLNQSRRGTSRISAGPGKGPYYWVPYPDGHWQLWSVRVDREDEIPEHVECWKRVVAEIIATAWDKPDLVKQISRLPYSVPRGRVSYFDNLYFLNHGNDAPVADWKSQILRAFGLTSLAAARPDRLKIYHDGHEHMFPVEQLKLYRLLEMSSVQQLPAAAQGVLWG